MTSGIDVTVPEQGDPKTEDQRKNWQTAANEITNLQAAIATIQGRLLFVGDQPPPFVQGVLWFNSDDTQLYVGYHDAASSNWVPVVNQGGSGEIAMSGGAVTKVDHSGRISLGGQAQQLMAANPARRGWSLQNKSTGDMWFNDLGALADPNDAASVYLPPGAYYESEFSGSTASSISIYGSITNAPFVSKEW